MQIFEEFCSNSSIHGLRYWVDRERHWIERYANSISIFRICFTSLFHRVWWVTAFILSISCCISLVYTMWQKWAEFPVIISFDHQPLTISAVPFPATTICPFIKTKANVFNYTRVYRLISHLEENDQLAPNETELK